MHGPGGVGGDELHHDPLALQGLAAAIALPLPAHRVQYGPVPAAAQAEVEKSRAGDLRAGKVAAGEIQMLQKGRRDLPGALLHGLGRSQGEGGGVVAVGRVLGDLHPGPDVHAAGELPRRGGGPIGGQGQLQHLILGLLNHIGHNGYLPLSRTRILNWFSPVT